MPYFETSASNGENVTPAVECLLNLVMNRIERNGALLADQLPVRRYGTRNSRPDDPDSFALGDTDAQKESNCSCWPATTSDIQEYSISSQYLTPLFSSVLSSVHSGLLLIRSSPRSRRRSRDPPRDMPSDLYCIYISILVCVCTLFSSISLPTVIVYSLILVA